MYNGLLIMIHEKYVTFLLQNYKNIIDNNDNIQVSLIYLFNIRNNFNNFS